jgi:hypothetical protein
MTSGRKYYNHKEHYNSKPLLLHNKWGHSFIECPHSPCNQKYNLNKEFIEKT